MKKALILAVTVCLVTMGITVLPAIALDAPIVTLDRIEVKSIQPFFVKPKLMKPSKEDPKKKVEFTGKYGYSSSLSLAYVLNIKNPNKEPVMLDDLQFTVMFNGFEINTLIAYDDAWIPAGKTNQVRVVGINEAFPTIVSLMVGAGNAARAKSLGKSAGALVVGWWKGIAEFSFPIQIENGMAVFQDAKGKEIRSAFKAEFGKK